MNTILTCMLIDPYFCLLAIAQFVSWIGFFGFTIWAMKKILFDRKDECYE